MDFTEMELSEASRSSLRASVQNHDTNVPVIIVAVSDKYALFLDNWLCHMERINVGNLLIVAMDDAIAKRLKQAGIAAARCEFDGSWSDFWYRRFLIWDFLITEGRDIIHSDVDAIWLRDPIGKYFSDAEIDMVWSQGTLHPNDVWSAWGFVLCTGLFGARASAGTSKFFATSKLRAKQMLETTDQTILNQVLNDHGTIWDGSNSGRYNLDWHGTPYDCFGEMIKGSCKTLGLRLALLPYHLFPRSPVAGSDEAFVKHLHPTPGGDYRSPEGRLPQMRSEGCWILDRVPGKLEVG